MKALTCEMCGSTNLIKDGGVFVCQSCGTKYSVEEAKKMMIEGTVSVQGTVVVDQTLSINNYLIIAKNALQASNYLEAESYSNKIIEIDQHDSNAWFVKGVAAGWQSTLANIRLGESLNCFTNAINFTKEENVKEMKEAISDAFASLLISIAELSCNHFSQFPQLDTAVSICKNFEFIDSIIIPFIEQCEGDVELISSDFANKIVDSCVAIYNQSKSTYKSTKYNSNIASSNYVKVGFSCINILDCIVKFEHLNNNKKIDIYKTMIGIQKEFIKAIKLGSEGDEFILKKEERKKHIDEIMEWHSLIHELDSTYIIPKRPAVGIEGGCYTSLITLIIIIIILVVPLLLFIHRIKTMGAIEF